jgi:histidinol-phosphate aminotransferase
MKPNPETLVRPLVRRLHPYVPGEQPRIKGLVKLNTNENPYPPAPEVLEAVRNATDDRLRLYPPPTAQGLRETLAGLHGVGVENVIVGNGSDELLALATRALVEPTRGGGRAGARPGAAAGREVIQYFVPSYSLYPVLGGIHGAVCSSHPLKDDFDLPTVAELKGDRRWNRRAALTFITTPNAPSGRGYTMAQLEAFCAWQRGVVILDEAYVDFARENAMELAGRHPHVLVSRTFSKAYSLCFQRIGYFVGHPVLISAMDRIRDSYNVNGLGQVAALSTLEHLPYYRENFARIIRTRDRLSAELQTLGFSVLPSQTNFILVKPPGPAAETWSRALRESKILVRWFDYPRVRSHLRITIGTEGEAGELIRVIKRLLGRFSRG